MVKVEESLEALTHARWPGDERSNERNMDAHLPSVPNLMLEDPVIKGQQGQSRNMALHANTITLTTSVASTAFLLQSSATAANPVCWTHSHNKGLTRLH